MCDRTFGRPFDYGQTRGISRSLPSNRHESRLPAANPRLGIHHALFGASLPRFSPRQADVLFVVGTISHKLAPFLRASMTGSEPEVFGRIYCSQSSCQAALAGATAC